MNVSDELLKIHFLLTQDGSVAVLKQMPAAFMPLIEIYRVTRQQAMHERVQGSFGRREQQVNVIWDQCPSIANDFTFSDQPSQTPEELLFILAIAEYCPPFDAASNGMIEDSRDVNSRLAGHIPFDSPGRISFRYFNVFLSYKSMNVPHSGISRPAAIGPGNP